MKNIPINIFLPFLVVTITQLHLLRNFSQIYYLFYFAISFLSFFYFIFNINKITTPLILLVLIFLYPLFPFLWSFYNSPYDENGGYFIGVSRVIFSTPMLLTLISSPSTESQINYELKIASFFFLLAGLFIPYQWLFGPIDWFAEGSFRSGLPRYASLLGSLTTFGQFVGGALIISIYSFKNFYIKIFIALALIICAVLSLQKSAILNVVIALIFIPFIFNIKFNKFFILKLMITTALSTIIFLLINELLNNSLMDYLNSLRFFSGDISSVNSDDYSIEESLFQRIVDLPIEAINYHGFYSIFFGVGPIGGAGAFGYPEVPMSHNGLVDLLLIGGVPYFFIFISFVILIALKICLIPNISVAKKVGFFLLISILLNLQFAGLIYYVPMGALFFIMATKIIFSKNEKVA